MEKIRKSAENQPTVFKYDALINTLYLGIAREHRLPGAIESDDFSALLDSICNTDEERYEMVSVLGAHFDRAMTELATTSIMLARKNVVVEVPPNGGIGKTDYYPWEEKVNEHLSQLQKDTLKESRRSFTVQRTASRQPATDEPGELVSAR